MIGQIVKHPDGYYVYILDGVPEENFWYWKRVNADGTLGRLTWGTWS